MDWAEKWKKWIVNYGTPIEDVEVEKLNEWADGCVSAYLQEVPLKSFSISFNDKSGFG